MRKHLKEAGPLIVIMAVWMVIAHGSSAQALPWDTFVDSESESVCDLINAASAELVVLGETGELVIVTGTDVVLAGTSVSANGEVQFQGAAFGRIGFAVDGDGFRTLWWTTLTGRVVDLDGFTGAPFETDTVPGDYVDVPCDACPSWDDPTACLCLDDSDCDDGNACTEDLCADDGSCAFLSVSCDDLDACTLDLCDPAVGCVEALVFCDDSDECTEDSCLPSVGCVFEEVDCSDGNVCTDDVCENGLCLSLENTAACNDGNACTTADLCEAGVCTGVPISGCGVAGPPIGLVFNFCGAAGTLALTLTFSSLGAMRWSRRRSRDLGHA